MGFETTKNTYADRTGSRLKFTSVMDGNGAFFLAFLTSFAQSFQSEWNTETVYGRNDPIATFRGTTRTLSLSWDVPAGNLIEAKRNLDKFSTLTQIIYPSYTTGTSIAPKTDGTKQVSSNALTLSKSPLIRLKFANLIDDASGKKEGLLGYITSLDWNPVLDMGMFTEVLKPENTDMPAKTNLYPKVVSLNVSFGVLHEHDLGTVPIGTSSSGFTPFPDSAKFPFGG